VVPHHGVGLSHVEAGTDPEPGLPPDRGDGQRASAGFDGLREGPLQMQGHHQAGQRPGQARLVVEGGRQRLSPTQLREAALLFVESDEGVVEGEPQVNGRFMGVLTLRAVRQGAQGPLEPGHRLAVGGARCRLAPGGPAVSHGLVPHLGSRRVVGQTLDLGLEPPRMKGFNGGDDPPVEFSALVGRQAQVGHVTCQRVPEPPERFPSWALLDEKLRCVKIPECGEDGVLLQGGGRRDQRGWRLPSDGRQRLEDSPLPGPEPVDPGA
jgi:hypothetical protein